MRQPSQTQPRNYMEDYIELLQDRYKRIPLISTEELFESTPTEYVDLQLVRVDDVPEAKTFLEQMQLRHCGAKGAGSLQLRQMFNFSTEEKKVVLIEGGPGMGKTTLAIEICRRWADSKLLQEYKAVILVILRDPGVQAAKSLDDLFQISSKTMLESIAEEIKSTLGENICFIFEGYDELPQFLRRAPVFAKLTEVLPKCMLVYTSRPVASVKLQRLASRRIIIGGFKEDQVDEYISRSFQEAEDERQKADDLKVQVGKNSMIRSFLSVPINLAIICHLFAITSSLPTTMTQLYNLLCLNLLRRFINMNTSEHVDALYSLDDLPPKAKVDFKKLCFIAFKGKETDQAIFSSRELKENYDITIGEKGGLGLLFIMPYMSEYGKEKVYKFIHMTLQEFCAAWYISKLTSEEQCQCFIKNNFFNSDFEMVWRFYSGITQLKNQKIVHLMLPSKWIKAIFKRMMFMELLHHLYEAQSLELCQLAGDHFEGCVDLRRYALNQSDCSALGYFVEQYQGMLHDLKMSSCFIEPEGAAIIQNSFKSRHDLGKPARVTLDVSNNESGTDRVKNVSYLMFHVLNSLNYPIVSLDLSKNVLSLQIDGLCKSLKHNTLLEELILRRTFLHLSDIQSLVETLSHNHTLQVLDISENKIQVKGACSLSDCRNASLAEVRLSSCGLHSKAAEEIGKMIFHNQSIRRLDLSNNEIGDNGVKKFLRHALRTPSLEHLDLGYSKISSACASNLNQLLANDHLSLTSIELSGNVFDDDGVDTVFKEAPHALKHIGLVGIELASFLEHGLCNVESLTFTVPDDCHDGIGRTLARISMLKHLGVHHGSDSGYHFIFKGIAVNSSIESLTVSGGTIGQLAMPELLECIKSLKELTIEETDGSAKDFMLLLTALALKSSVKCFRAKAKKLQNLFDHSAVLEVFEMLKQNYTLEMFSLSVPEDEIERDFGFIAAVEQCVNEINVIREDNPSTNALLHFEYLIF